MVSPFVSKKIYLIQQEVKGNDFPEGQGKRNIYEDRVFQSPSTAQSKMNILHTMLLGEKPSDTSKTPRSREDPVKNTDMLQFCKGFGVITEGRDRESAGFEHHNPGLHCLS